MSNYCYWCQRYLGDNGGSFYNEFNEDGNLYRSNERFCSRKCQHNYESAGYDYTYKRIKGCSEYLPNIVLVIAILFALSAFIALLNN